MQTCPRATAHAQSRGQSTSAGVQENKKMKFEIVLVILALLAAVCWAEKKNGLRIGVKKRPETCDMRSKNGDKLSMHYTVSVLYLFDVVQVVKGKPSGQYMF